MTEIKAMLDSLSNNELTRLLSDEIMTSNEVIEYLELTRARLSTLDKTGKLKPFKKGIYLRREVEHRKQEQDELRDKYLHTDEYKK